MDEVKRALKGLVVTFLVVLAMQTHVGGVTIEDHADRWLRTSATAKYLHKVAEGANLAIHNAGKAVASFAGRTLGEGDTQRASRLSLGLDRSEAAVSGFKNKKSPPAVDGDED